MKDHDIPESEYGSEEPGGSAGGYGSHSASPGNKTSPEVQKKPD